MAVAMRTFAEKKTLETQRIESVSWLTTRKGAKVLLTGSSAAVVNIGPKLFTYTPPSEDTDMIIDRHSLEALVKMFRGKEAKWTNLIDSIKDNSHTMAGGTYAVQKNSPFVHYMVRGLESFDFFRKSVGVIPFGEKEFEEYCTLQVNSGGQNYEIRTASKPFLTATYLNPVAVTEIRAKRGGLMAIKALEEYDNIELFTRNFVAPAVDYIGQGEKVVQTMLKRVEGSPTYRHVFSNKDYTEYAKKMRKNVPNYLENIRNKILRLADALEIGRGHQENLNALNALIKEMRA